MERRPLCDFKRALRDFKRHHAVAIPAESVTVPVNFLCGPAAFPLVDAAGSPGDPVIVALRTCTVYTVDDVQVRPRLLSSPEMFNDEEINEAITRASKKTSTGTLQRWRDAIVHGTFFRFLATKYKVHQPASYDRDSYALHLAAKFVNQGGLCAFSGVPMRLTANAGDKFRCVLTRDGKHLVCAALRVNVLAEDACTYWDTSVTASTGIATTCARILNADKNTVELKSALMQWRQRKRGRR